MLETQVEQSDSHLPLQTPFKTDSKRIQTLFKNNSEKYEYLIIHNPQDKWIEQFKQTKEYKLLYE